MRPPALPQRSRAIVASIGAHAVLLPLIFAVGGLGRSISPQPQIIEAELVSLVPSQPTAPAPAAPVEEPTPDDAPAVEPVPAQPTPPPEPAERAEPPPAPREPVAPRLAESSPAPRAAESADTAESSDRAAVDEPVAAPPLERVADTAGASPAKDQAVPEAADDATLASAVVQQPLDADNARLLGRISSWTGEFAPDATAQTLRWREDGQEFTAVLRKLPSSDVMGMEQVAVDVTTVRDGERLQAELRMTRLAFSNFAQFVDRWDRGVQIHDDEIDGRFHSNTAITVGSSGRVRPIFGGKVTLAARDVTTSDGGRVNRRRMFPAGLETSVRRIGLPRRAVALDSLTAGVDHVRRFARDTHLTFYADGSYGWRETDAASEQRARLTSEPHYLIGGKDVTLHVAGTVDGTVLVYTEGRIVIAGNLRYAADPHAPGADDYLGLVAEGNVEIAEPASTGPGDLEVHASIYARRQFAVRSYLSRRSGTLRIVGSVAAGSVTATEPRYATKIDFDERLTTMRAPGFPLSDRYELTSWSGEWRRAPAGSD